jgi:hypothetical protein
LNADTFPHIFLSSPTKQPQYVVMVLVMVVVDNSVKILRGGTISPPDYVIALFTDIF